MERSGTLHFIEVNADAGPVIVLGTSSPDLGAVPETSGCNVKAHAE